MGENHKFFFFFLNSLRSFVGFDLLEAPTPKIWKKLFPIGYTLIEVPITSKMWYLV